MVARPPLFWYARWDSNPQALDRSPEWWSGASTNSATGALCPLNDTTFTVAATKTLTLQHLLDLADVKAYVACRKVKLRHHRFCVFLLVVLVLFRWSSYVRAHERPFVVSTTFAAELSRSSVGAADEC